MRARTALVSAAAVVAAATCGGSIAASPPGDPGQGSEERAELAFQKYLIGNGARPIAASLACNVAADASGVEWAYCYATTDFGIMAANAPIPPNGGAWTFQLTAGALPSGGAPLPSTIPTSVPSVPPVPPGTATVPPTSAPVPAVTPAPGGSIAPSFGEGVFRVNTEIPPGRYQAEGSDFCYWARLSAPDDPESIITNWIESGGPTIVDIEATDAAFESNGCGKWHPYTPPPVPATSFGSGTFAVGTDIQPGAYRASGGENCYWRRLAGFRGGLDDLIDIDRLTTPGTVIIASTDIGFSSTGCGDWTLT